MPFRIVVKEAERVPKYYGAAYREFDRYVTICYPVPFHHVVRWWRDWWYKFRFGHMMGKHWDADHIAMIKEIRALKHEVSYLTHGTTDIEELYEEGIIRCPIK